MSETSGTFGESEADYRGHLIGCKSRTLTAFIESECDCGIYIKKPAPSAASPTYQCGVCYEIFPVGGQHHHRTSATVQVEAELAAASPGTPRLEDGFVRYEVVRQAKQEEGKPPRFTVYGFRSSGTRVALDQLYLRDHDVALASLRAELAEVKQSHDRLKRVQAEQVKIYQTLNAQHVELLRQRDTARALLSPNCAEETLLGAIRNLQQAHLSEKGNAEQAESTLASLRAELASLHQMRIEIWENPQKWMRWCDHKVLERAEQAESALTAMTAERDRLRAALKDHGLFICGHPVPTP
jgi:hypothetical protein